MRVISFLILFLSVSGCIGVGSSVVESTQGEAWVQAYREQGEALAERGSPLGFKAGLTSAQSQLRFNSDRAVAGNLYQRFEAGASVRLEDFTRPMLEVELAFRLRHRLNQRVNSIAELKQLVVQIAPAFELPDLGFIPTKTPGPMEIIKANVAARGFIVDERQSLDLTTFEALNIVLWHDGELALEANANSLLGGQWAVLLELVNNRIAAGWQITPDQWLLTGAIGGMQVLQLGDYVVDFKTGNQGLGRIQLTVDR